MSRGGLAYETSCQCNELQRPITKANMHASTCQRATRPPRAVQHECLTHADVHCKICIKQLHSLQIAAGLSDLQPTSSGKDRLATYT